MGTKNLVATGRVREDGTAPVSAGLFKITKASTGTWHLEIEGHSLASGTLLVSAEGGRSGGANVDNVVSAQWDDRRKFWVIESRDLTNYNLQDGLFTDEEMFSFAFFRHYEPLYVDPSALGANDGSSWLNAYTDLQDGFNAAADNPGQNVWVAEGFYRGTFTLAGFTGVFGGFPAGGGTQQDRSPSVREIILSGFARTIVTASPQSTLDGFTIRDGNDRVEDSFGRDPSFGIAVIGDNLTMRNCIIEDNVSFGADFNFIETNSNSTGVAPIVSCFNKSLIEKCIFRRNAARGELQPVLGVGSVLISQTLIHGNNAAALGITTHSSIGIDELPVFENCTITGNLLAVPNAALRNTPTSSGILRAIFRNCILWNNGTPMSWQNLDGDPPETTFINTILEGSGGSAGWNSLLYGSDGQGNLDANPLFVDDSEVNSLGLTSRGDFRLGAGSPALDAGQVSVLSDLILTPEKDLANNDRLQGAAIDLGAYEGVLNIRFVDASQTSGSANGLSWNTAFPNLNDALDSASLGTQLYVAGGIYSPDEGTGRSAGDRSESFVLKQGVDILGSFPPGGGTLGQRSLVNHATILSGDLAGNDSPAGGQSENSYHVLTADNVRIPILLSSLIIEGGNANGGTPSSNAGGGFAFEVSAPRFEGCVFRENSASVQGGAGYLTGSIPTFVNCFFTKNRAKVASVLVSENSSSPLFQNCTIVENGASNEIQLFINDNSSPRFVNTLLWANSFSQQFAFTNLTGSHPTFQNCLLKGSGGSAFWETSFGTDLGGNVEGNPAFDSQVFGTLEQQFSIITGSSAENSGIGVNNLSRDLLGNPRVVGDAIDIGAFELQASPLPPLYVAKTYSAAGVSGDGSSWAQAFRTLEEALAVVLPDLTILVQRGIYYPNDFSGSDDRASTFLIPERVRIVGGFDGTESDVSESQPRINRTYLSGDLNQDDTIDRHDDNAYHVVTTEYIIGSPQLIEGFTIQGGRADGGTNMRGGGLFCDSRNRPLLIDCRFLDNHATQEGGAIYGAPAQILNCLFKGNSAEEGGAIFRFFGEPWTLINCGFQGNFASRDGGAIYNESSPNSDTFLINITAQGNTAGVAGGAFFTSQGSLKIVNSLITDNAAAGVPSECDSSAPNILTSTVAQINRGEVIVRESVIETCPTNLPSWFIAGAGVTYDADSVLEFAYPLNPLEAPSQEGSLAFSSAPNTGDATANPTARDLDGNQRIGTTGLRLGAYQLAKPALHVGPDAGMFSTLQDALAIAQSGQTIFISPGLYYPDEGSGQTDGDRNSRFVFPRDLILVGTISNVSGNSFNTAILSGDLAQNETEHGETSDPSLTSDNAFNLLILDENSGETQLKNICISRGELLIQRCSPRITNSLIESLTTTPFTLNGVADSPIDHLIPQPHLRETTVGTVDSFGRPGICIIGRRINGSSDLSGSLIGPQFDDFLQTVSTSPSRLHNYASSGGKLNLDGRTEVSQCQFTNSLEGAIVLGTPITNSGQNINSSFLTIYNCAFQGCLADNGAAIQLLAGAEAEIAGCLFAGNFATVSGGAIYTHLDCSLSIINCTFGNNRSPLGGAIRSRDELGEIGTLAVINSIFWGNQNIGSVGVLNENVEFDDQSQKSFRNSILQGSGGSSSWRTSPAGSQFGTDLGGNIDSSPRFVDSFPVPLPPTISGNYRLTDSSPALGTGRNFSNTLTFDLDGEPRIQNGTIDMGAYEGIGGGPVIPEDPSDLWLTDDDGDGIVWGLEQALGTDPDVADLAHPQSFQLTSPMIGTDTFALKFGVSPNAVPGTVWRLSRSPDLSLGSFIEIYRYDGITESIPSQFAGTIETAFISQGIALQFEDQTNGAPRYFYQLEALYIP